MRPKVAAALTIVSLLAVPGIAWCPSVDVNQSLLNPSFESGMNGPCSTSWACGGGPPPDITSGVTNDVLPGILSDGVRVSDFPPIVSGPGTLPQDTSTTWIAGQQYTFTSWVDPPDKEPNRTDKEPNGTDVASGLPQTVMAMILSNGVVANLNDNGPIRFGIASAGQRNGEQIAETLTAGQDTGQSIGVDFAVSTAANKENFDVSPVPEPATMFLGGLALVTLGYAARRRLFRR